MAKGFFWRYFKWITLAIFVVLAIPLSTITIGSWTYSDGERSGTITKFSNRRGGPMWMFKTWEGELRMGGLDQGGQPEHWEFSVDDGDIVKKVQEAQRHGGKWTLKYRQQFMSQSWKGATDYFVVDLFKEDR